MRLPEAQLDRIRAKAVDGNPESQFLLSQICLQNGDIAGMVNWLHEACSNGVADAYTALGHCHERAMGVEQSFDTALELYDSALARGSLPAAYRKAELLYKSRQGPARENEIRDLLGKAAAAGFEPAVRTISYLAAQSGQPGAQLSSSVSLYPQTGELERRDYSDDPEIGVCNNVLDPGECAHLIALSRPYLRHSDVIDPESRKDGMISDVRTSSGTFLPFELVDIVGRYIETKIVNAVGEDLERSEPMSILRYAPGEYYRSHYDYFDPKLKISESLLQNGGQRRASAVTYLSVPAKGGGTTFSDLGLSIPPSPGATLYFRNCDARGNIDPRSLHAGDTVEEGEKWVVTKWFREDRTDYAKL